MTNISLADLGAVIGGAGDVCKRVGGSWTAKAPNQTLDTGATFGSKTACTAAVKRWSTSLMNVDNDRAD
jgi:hypothetical protein